MSTPGRTGVRLLLLVLAGVAIVAAGEWDRHGLPLLFRSLRPPAVPPCAGPGDAFELAIEGRDGSPRRFQTLPAGRWEDVFGSGLRDGYRDYTVTNRGAPGSGDYWRFSVAFDVQRPMRLYAERPDENADAFVFSARWGCSGPFRGQYELRPAPAGAGQGLDTLILLDLRCLKTGERVTGCLRRQGDFPARAAQVLEAFRDRAVLGLPEPAQPAPGDDSSPEGDGPGASQGRE